jgi:hypothetical protein
MGAHSKLEINFSMDNIAFKAVNFASIGLTSITSFFSAKFNFEWRYFKIYTHSF